MARPKKNEEATSKPTGSLMNRLKSSSKIDYAVVAAEDESYKTRDFIDSGNYLFNALLSADVRKGYASGKIYTLAGKSAVGKSFLALSAIRQAQAMGYTVVLYDSEFCHNDFDALKERGIKLESLLYIPVTTVEELRNSIVNILEELTTEDKVMFIFDSVGNLASEKEVDSALSNDGKTDMSKQKAIKSLFRLITIKCGMLQCPVIAIQHTYDSQSFIPQSIVSGGGGILFNSSVIITFTKAQDKGTEGVVGSIVTANNTKNRFSLEKAKVKFAISYKGGIDPYSGLCEFCEENGIFKKVGRGYEYNDQKIQKSDMTKDFWETLLNSGLAEIINDKFKYSSISEELLEDFDLTEGEEDA